MPVFFLYAPLNRSFLSLRRYHRVEIGLITELAWRDNAEQVVSVAVVGKHAAPIVDAVAPHPVGVISAEYAEPEYGSLRTVEEAHFDGSVRRNVLEARVGHAPHDAEYIR